MQSSGILFDSLPMVRLGIRDEDQTIVMAPDFSTFAYMLEEYIGLAATRIVIPTSCPESQLCADLPLLLQKRVVVIDDTSEREAASRVLHGLRAELGIRESRNGKRLRFPKGMPQEIRVKALAVHDSLARLAVGFNHGVQIGLSPQDMRLALRSLREEVRNKDVRVILAQLEGILAAYEKVRFESPHPNVATATDLISIFDRLINDPDYLGLSDAVSNLALPQKRRQALSRVRTFGRRLSKSGVAKGWNYVGSVLNAWTGMPLPEADTIFSFVSGKDLPVLVDLRPARKRAIDAWLKFARTSDPIAARKEDYNGLSWVMPAAPPGNWDGGALTSMSLGTVGNLKKELERFL